MSLTFEEIIKKWLEQDDHKLGFKEYIEPLEKTYKLISFPDQNSLDKQLETAFE